MTDGGASYPSNGINQLDNFLKSYDKTLTFKYYSV